MTDIQQARDVLAKWREEATAGRWIVDLDRGESFGAVDTPDVYSEDNADSVVLPAGTVGEHDIPLIVGTAGNPDFLDAIEALLANEMAESGVCHCGTDIEHHRFEEHGFVDMGLQPNPLVEPIAAAIIAADERMTS